jgi:hypothetical protein
MEVAFDFSDEDDIARYLAATGEARTDRFEAWRLRLVDLYGFTTITMHFPDEDAEPPRPSEKWAEWRG